MRSLRFDDLPRSWSRLTHDKTPDVSVAHRRASRGESDFRATQRGCRPPWTGPLCLHLFFIALTGLLVTLRRDLVGVHGVAGSLRAARWRIGIAIILRTTALLLSSRL